MTDMFFANSKNANKKIVKTINEWTIERLYAEYSLQEYLGLSNKEYSNWISGKWDANKIYARRELIRKLKRPYYKTIHFFEFFYPKNLLRFFKYKCQKIFRGWDDSETWDMRITFSEFILPRLKRFKEVNNGYPGFGDADTFEKWDNILDKMIWSFEQILVDEEYPGDDEDLENDTYPNMRKLEEHNLKIQEGLDLFAKYFQHLWW
jgi:hypothetical protein